MENLVDKCFLGVEFKISFIFDFFIFIGFFMYISIVIG